MKKKELTIPQPAELAKGSSEKVGGSPKVSAKETRLQRDSQKRRSLNFWNR